MKTFTRFLALLLSFSLTFEPVVFAQATGALDISGYIAGLHNAIPGERCRPFHVRSLSYDQARDDFNLLVDKGDAKNAGKPEVEAAARALLDYFLIGLSLPNDAFWVNLRPGAQKDMADPDLAKTDVGRIFLEADVQLKKDTASATSPETTEGKQYWDKLYQKAQELLGNEEVSIPTLTRPWIVPGEIIIRETADSAYIYKATLKVMLEQDYLKGAAEYKFDDPRMKALNEYSSQLIRELIIPRLNRELNTAKRYAPLRQVYYSLILAQWFKSRFRGSAGQYAGRIDTKDLSGLGSKTEWSPEPYYNAYQKSFKDGEYNIKKPVEATYSQTVRSYFSGGIVFNTHMPAAPAAVGGSQHTANGPITITTFTAAEKHDPAVGNGMIRVHNGKVAEVTDFAGNTREDFGKKGANDMTPAAGVNRTVTPVDIHSIEFQQVRMERIIGTLHKAALTSRVANELKDQFRAFLGIELMELVVPNIAPALTSNSIAFLYSGGRGKGSQDQVTILLSLAQRLSDDELAWVIAHEWVHEQIRTSLLNGGSGNRGLLAEEQIQRALTAYIYAGDFMDLRAYEDARLSMVKLGQALQAFPFYKPLIEAASQKEERAADLIGVLLTMWSGYDPAAGISVLEMFKENRENHILLPGQMTETIKRPYVSHPDINDRLQGMRDQVMALGSGGRDGGTKASSARSTLNTYITRLFTLTDIFQETSRLLSTDGQVTHKDLVGALGKIPGFGQLTFKQRSSIKLLLLQVLSRKAEIAREYAVAAARYPLARFGEVSLRMARDRDRMSVDQAAAVKAELDLLREQCAPFFEQRFGIHHSDMPELAVVKAGVISFEVEMDTASLPKARTSAAPAQSKTLPAGITGGTEQALNPDKITGMLKDILRELPRYVMGNFHDEMIAYLANNALRDMDFDDLIETYRDDYENLLYTKIIHNGYFDYSGLPAETKEMIGRLSHAAWTGREWEAVKAELQEVKRLLDEAVDMKATLFLAESRQDQPGADETALKARAFEAASQYVCGVLQFMPPEKARSRMRRVVERLADDCASRGIGGQQLLRPEKAPLSDRENEPGEAVIGGFRKGDAIFSEIDPQEDIFSHERQHLIYALYTRGAAGAAVRSLSDFSGMLQERVSALADDPGDAERVLRDGGEAEERNGRIKEAKTLIQQGKITQAEEALLGLFGQYAQKYYQDRGSVVKDGSVLQVEAGDLLFMAELNLDNVDLWQFCVYPQTLVLLRDYGESLRQMGELSRDYLRALEHSATAKVSSDPARIFSSPLLDGRFVSLAAGIARLYGGRRELEGPDGARTRVRAITALCRMVAGIDHESEGFMPADPAARDFLEKNAEKILSLGPGTADIFLDLACQQQRARNRDFELSPGYRNSLFSPGIIDTVSSYKDDAQDVENYLLLMSVHPEAERLFREKGWVRNFRALSRENQATFARCLRSLANPSGELFLGEEVLDILLGETVTGVYNAAGYQMDMLLKLINSYPGDFDRYMAPHNLENLRRLAGSGLGNPYVALYRKFGEERGLLLADDVVEAIIRVAGSSAGFEAVRDYFKLLEFKVYLDKIISRGFTEQFILIDPAVRREFLDQLKRRADFAGDHGLFFSVAVAEVLTVMDPGYVSALLRKLSDQGFAAIIADDALRARFIAKMRQCKGKWNSQARVIEWADSAFLAEDANSGLMERVFAVIRDAELYRRVAEAARNEDFARYLSEGDNLDSLVSLAARSPELAREYVAALGDKLTSAALTKFGEVYGEILRTAPAAFAIELVRMVAANPALAGGTRVERFLTVFRFSEDLGRDYMAAAAAHPAMAESETFYGIVAHFANMEAVMSRFFAHRVGRSQRDIEFSRLLFSLQFFSFLEEAGSVFGPQTVLMFVLAAQADPAIGGQFLREGYLSGLRTNITVLFGEDEAQLFEQKVTVGSFWVLNETPEKFGRHVGVLRGLLGVETFDRWLISDGKWVEAREWFNLLDAVPPAAELFGRLREQVDAVGKTAGASVAGDYLTILGKSASSPFLPFQLQLGIREIQPWLANLTALGDVFAIHDAMLACGIDAGLAGDFCGSLVRSGVRDHVYSLRVFREVLRWHKEHLDAGLISRVLSAGSTDTGTKDGRRNLKAKVDTFRYVADIVSKYGRHDLAKEVKPILADCVAKINAILAEDFDVRATPQRIAGLQREFMRRLVSQLTGVDAIPDGLLDAPEAADKVLTIANLYYTLSAHTALSLRDRDSVRGKIRELLKEFIVTNGDRELLKKLVLEEEGNAAEIERLLGMEVEGRRYDRRLWQEGIEVKSEARPTAQSPEQVRQAAEQAAHELVEIAHELGYAPDGMALEDLEQIRLRTYDEAKDFVAKMAVALQGNPAAGARCGQILTTVKGIEEAVDVATPVTVVIRKDFIEEATAGMGVPGCFSPDGIHREMPPVHALEANAFFAFVYDDAGRMFANAVLVMTDKGAVVFGSYNSRPGLDLGEAWFTAWQALSLHVPAVILPKTEKDTAAGRAFVENSGFGSRVDSLEVTQAKTLFGQMYYDFGVSDNDGNWQFSGDAVVLTREMFAGMRAPGIRVVKPRGADADTVSASPALQKEERDQIRKLLFSLDLDMELGPVLSQMDGIILSFDEAKVGKIIASLKSRGNRGERASIQDRVRLGNVITELIYEFRVRKACDLFAEELKKRIASGDAIDEETARGLFHGILTEKMNLDLSISPSGEAVKAGSPGKRRDLPPEAIIRLNQVLDKAGAARVSATAEPVSTAEALFGEYVPSEGETLARGEISVFRDGKVEVRFNADGEGLARYDQDSYPEDKGVLQFELYRRAGELRMEVVDLISKANLSVSMRCYYAFESLAQHVADHENSPVTLEAETAVFKVRSRWNGARFEAQPRGRDVSSEFGWVKTKPAQTRVKQGWIDTIQPLLRRAGIIFEDMATEGIDQENFGYYHKKITPSARERAEARAARDGGMVPVVRAAAERIASALEEARKYGVRDALQNDICHILAQNAGLTVRSAGGKTEEGLFVEIVNFITLNNGIDANTLQQIRNFNVLFNPVDGESFGKLAQICAFSLEVQKALNPELQMDNDVAAVFRSVGILSGAAREMGAPGRDGGAGNQAADQESAKKGGIDFRALPAAIQPSGPLELSPAEMNRLGAMDIGAERAKIMKMIKGGIMPSNERVKEYVLACCARQRLETELDKVLGCIAAVLRLEEERASEADAVLRDLLVVVESGRPSGEIRGSVRQMVFAPAAPKSPK